MFYHNTKYKFALAEGSPTAIAGGIIAASAMPEGQLVRRVRKDLRKHSYLQHRLFDPQLYLACLDKNTARKTVINLASYSWFAHHNVPAYDSKQHGTLQGWKALHEDQLVASWTGKAPERAADIERAVRAAVQHQVDLGCHAIILPAPLTNIATQNFETETNWIDIGIDICRDMKVGLPVYASIALSDVVLRGVDPAKNTLLHTITNQLSAREYLNGAYLVIEQTVDDGYFCASRDTLLSALLMVDDLARGAGRQVIVNYLGTFGPVAMAAGASIWSTGYYQTQRRLRLADFDDKMGMAYPRFYSAVLAGDIGLEADLSKAYNNGLSRVLSSTPSSAPLEEAIQNGTYPESVPQWEYRQSNLTAATAHYNAVCYILGGGLLALDAEKRRQFVERWLKGASKLVAQLQEIGIQNSPQTPLRHQNVWLDVYAEWLRIRNS